ncbi:hypothetical protein AB0K74_48260, partial [Streptomyces sp. NPDC056159]
MVAGLATVGLALVAMMKDLDTTAQAATVAGAVATLATLLVSVIALFRGGDGAGVFGAGRPADAADRLTAAQG